jgi:hypothetical protein
MKGFKGSLIFPLAFAGFLLASQAAKADTLTLTLDRPYQIGASGLFDFYGTIAYTSADATNDGDLPEYLNGATVIFTDPVSLATYDATPFYSNTPISMNEGDSTGDVELFTVTVPDYIAGSSNLYAGTFEVLGGTSSDGNEPDGQLMLASEDFNIQVTPEPSSLLLLCTGLFIGLLKLGGRNLRRRLIL